MQVRSVQPGCGSRGLLPPAWARLSLRRQLSFSQARFLPICQYGIVAYGDERGSSPAVYTNVRWHIEQGWLGKAITEASGGLGLGLGFWSRQWGSRVGTESRPTGPEGRRRAAGVHARHMACMQVLYGNTGDTVSFKTLELQPCSALPSNKARGCMLCMLVQQCLLHPSSRALLPPLLLAPSCLPGPSCPKCLPCSTAPTAPPTIAHPSLPPLSALLAWQRAGSVG